MNWAEHCEARRADDIAQRVAEDSRRAAAQERARIMIGADRAPAVWYSDGRVLFPGRKYRATTRATSSGMTPLNWFQTIYLPDGAPETDEAFALLAFHAQPIQEVGGVLDMPPKVSRR